MANKEKSAITLNKTSGMLWFDILTRILMPIQAVLFFVISEYNGSISVPGLLGFA